MCLEDVSETEYRVAIKLDVPAHEDEEDDAREMTRRIPRDYVTET